MAHYKKTAEWIQKALLENALAEETNNKQALTIRAHDQQKDINFLNNQLSEYEAVIVNRETQAKQNEEKALDLQEALTRERRLAETNESYTQQVEQRCSELEDANANLLQWSADRKQLLKAQLHNAEERVRELERALVQSSAEVRQYKQQIQKDMGDWLVLRQALEANKAIENEKIKRLNGSLTRMMEMATSSDTLCQTIMQQLEIQQAELHVRRANMEGPGYASGLSLTAPRDVEMQDAPYAVVALRDPGQHIPMTVGYDLNIGGKDQFYETGKAKANGPKLSLPTIRSVTTESIRSIGDELSSLNETDGMFDEDDTVMRSSTSSTPKPLVLDTTECSLDAGPVEDAEDIGISFYYRDRNCDGTGAPSSQPGSPVSSSDSGSDEDTIVFSHPPSIRFPSRKRARYVMSSGSSSSSELEDEDLSTFKRMKVCQTCGRPDPLPRYMATSLTGSTDTRSQHSMASQRGGLHPTANAQPISTATDTDRSVHTTSPNGALAVSPKLPQMESSLMVTQGTQVEDCFLTRSRISVQREELPIRSVHTQTDAPSTVSRGIQVGKDLEAYMMKTWPSTQPSELRPTRRARHALSRRARSFNDQSVHTQAKNLMPGMWPRNSTPETVGNKTSMALVHSDPGDTARRIVGHCERTRQAIGVWLLRMLQEQPRELILSMVSLVMVLYWWPGDRDHRQWISANEIPRRALLEVRDPRVLESRWMESINYEFTTWLDLDRVALG